MELVRALTRAAQTAWLAGMTGLGAPSLRPSAPRTDPPNRMVEPESRGHSDFPFWAQPFALLPYPYNPLNMWGLGDKGRENAAKRGQRRRAGLAHAGEPEHDRRMELA